MNRKGRAIKRVRFLGNLRRQRQRFLMSYRLYSITPEEWEKQAAQTAKRVGSKRNGG